LFKGWWLFPGLTVGTLSGLLVTAVGGLGPAGALSDPAGCCVVGVFLTALMVVVVPPALSLARRRWLTVTMRGVVVSGWRTRVAIADEQVTGMSQRCKQDEKERWHVRLVLETEVPGARHLNLEYHGRRRQANPLAPLLERLTQRLVRHARQAVAAGAVLRGDGWELTAEELCVHALGLTVPLSSLARASFHHKHLCIWAHGEVRPVLALPDHQRNVQALAHVLQDHAREDHARPVPHPLGRLLFEWRYVQSIPLSFIRDFAWLRGLVLLGILVGLFAGLRSLKADSLPGLIFTIAAIPAMLALEVFVLWWRPMLPLLHGHERGVALVRRGKERLLPFDSVGELTWKRKMKFSLCPFPGAEAPVVRSPLPDREVPDLIAMRDAACLAIAQRMAAHLEQGEPVQWTNTLRFLPTGLEVRRSGEPLVLPYQYLRYEILPAAFVIYTGSEPDPVVRAPLTMKNAYPSLALLDRMRHGLEEPAAKLGLARPTTFQLPASSAAPAGEFTQPPTGTTPGERGA
jgi:hypothetical protein